MFVLFPQSAPSAAGSASVEDIDRPPSSLASETPRSNKRRRTAGADTTLMSTLASLQQQLSAPARVPTTQLESLVNRSLTARSAFGTWVGQSMAEFDTETYMQCSRDINNLVFHYMQVNYQRQQQTQQQRHTTQHNISSSISIHSNTSGWRTSAASPAPSRNMFSRRAPPSAFNRFCSSSPTPAATAAGLSNSMDFSFSSLLGRSASVLLNNTLSDDQHKPADNPNLDTPRRPHTPHCVQCECTCALVNTLHHSLNVTVDWSPSVIIKTFLLFLPSSFS